MTTHGSGDNPVDEAIQFLQNGHLLPELTTLPKALDHVLQVTTVSEKSRWSTNDDARIELMDIRQLALAGVYAQKLEHAQGYNIPEELDKQIHRSVEEKLSNLLDKRVVSEVVADFYAIVLVRSVLGRTVGFWDRMFRVYMSGGVPIAWSGPRDSGQIVAYYRCCDLS